MEAKRQAVCILCFFVQVFLNEEMRSQINTVVDGVSYVDQGFSEDFFIRPPNVLSFFQSFSLVKLHLLNCESFLYLREAELLNQDSKVVSAWLDLAEQVSHVHWA
jgi:hypothetical protein